MGHKKRDYCEEQLLEDYRKLKERPRVIGFEFQPKFWVCSPF